MNTGNDIEGQADYDAVAELYDRAFRDIRVRRSEWRWINDRLRSLRTDTRALRVLDIGCGNGSLLIALRDQLQSGVGVDVSRRTIEIATQNALPHSQLSFHTTVDGTFPCEDDSIDVVISFLSFRYLDWDATLREVQRVLAPDGRLLVVDMVRQRVSAADARLVGRSALQHVLRPLREPTFHRDVAELTSHPAWRRMLQRNPIRTAEEYRACFQRWFPGQPIEALTTTWQKRVIAFDSGPFPAR